MFEEKVSSSVDQSWVNKHCMLAKIYVRIDFKEYVNLTFHIPDVHPLYHVPV